MCSDQRIGNKFLYPGLGYGGSCFPKDVLACISMGELSGRPTELLEAVHQVNQAQRTSFLAKITEHFDSLQGKTLAFWGIAFKPGTDDIREAPSLTLMQAVLDAGATVKAHDPVAHETCQQVMGDTISYFDNPYDALDGADALVICTDWGDFRAPDMDQMKQRLKDPLVFDGRNLYRLDDMAEKGFTYYSVGRATVNPAVPSA